MPDQAFFKVFATDASAASGLQGAFANMDPSAWNRAVDAAVLHQCAPLYRERLSELGLLHCLPGEAQDRLTQIARETALSNLQGLHQLHELMALLQQRAPLLVLKGGYLARACYRDISLRPMRDLDVLARPGDVAMISEVIRGLGYEQDRRFEEAWSQLHQEPAFMKRGALPVELHRSLLDNETVFGIDYDGLWARAVPAKDIPGLLYMAPEDQLVHLCLHAGYCNGLDIGLYAFNDIAMMAAASGLSWPLLVERAQEWRAGRCVFLTLRMAQVLVGATVPAEVTAALRPADFSADVLDRAVASVQHKLAEGYVPASLLAHFVVMICDRERRRALPAKVKRYLLLKREERQTWKDSPYEANWYRQLEPLLKGALGLVTSRAQRDQFRARLNGARLRRWMEPPR